MGILDMSTSKKEPSPSLKHIEQLQKAVKEKRVVDLKQLRKGNQSEECEEGQSQHTSPERLSTWNYIHDLPLNPHDPSCLFPPGPDVLHTVVTFESQYQARACGWGSHTEGYSGSGAECWPTCVWVDTLAAECGEAP